MLASRRRRIGRSSQGHGMIGAAMTATVQPSPVFPQGTRVNARGRLEIGGCDVVELAREFGTPAYVVAEEDLRARARAFVSAVSARHDNFDVLFASKAFPCTAVYRVLAQEGLACDVASGGELHMALRGGFDPARIYLHGNAKSRAELREAHRGGRRPRRSGLAATTSSASAGLRGAQPSSGRAAARHPGRVRRYAPKDLDRASGLEVRVLARAGGAGDRASGRRARARARRPALPHRLSAARARAVCRRGRGAGPAG